MSLARRTICNLIAGSRFTWANEKQLQDGIAMVLAPTGLAVSREHRLSDRDCIDFLVESVGVEVKIKGSVTQVQAQLERYAEHAEVTELVLVTGRTQLTAMPRKLNGKPLTVLPLLGSLL